MTLLKCKMCGGNIEISSDRTYGTCDSCGCTSTFPKIDDEQQASLFNRGNDLRMRGEFDKASAVFERIVEQDTSNAEAHWCLALCRYGVEYVEDPNSGERMPTCHRTSFKSFLDDVDYIAAIENSDEYTASLYTAEAKRIAYIQTSILAISKKEDPFDIFICYKETTDVGSRTKDSTMAQDIYYELTNAGYKVFFSRITLEDKLGVEFEPYIFAALNSAKVMLVIGTLPEYLNAVWVKNEWKRFLSIMKNDCSRILIPCYRDMDPYDLPDELAMLQSQDMGKIGFIQDLIRGIKKIMSKYSGSEVMEAHSQNAVVQNILGLERLIKNGQTYLSFGDYTAAEEIYRRITKEYPEDHRGWWGLIFSNTLGLSNTDHYPATVMWFQNIQKLALPKDLLSLEKSYSEYRRKVSTDKANSILEGYKQNINQLRQNIISIENKNNDILKRKETEAKSDQPTRHKNDTLEYQRKEYNSRCNQAHKEAGSYVWPILGIIQGVACLPLLIHAFSGDSTALLVVIGALVLVFFSIRSIWKKNSKVKVKLQDAKEKWDKAVAYAQENYEHQEAERESRIRKLNSEIGANLDAIEKNQRQIAELEVEINRGIEAIAEEWYIKAVQQ